KIAVAALGDFDHGRWTARAGYPDRRKGFLQRVRPKINVAERKVATFMTEETVFSPEAHLQSGGLPETLLRLWRYDSVLESFGSGAGGETGDQTPVAHLIEHRVFLGHAHGIHMEGKEIAEDDDLSPCCSLRQRRRDDIRRGHQAVDILMVFVKY